MYSRSFLRSNRTLSDPIGKSDGSVEVRTRPEATTRLRVVNIAVAWPPSTISQPDRGGIDATLAVEDAGAAACSTWSEQLLTANATTTTTVIQTRIRIT